MCTEFKLTLYGNTITVYMIYLKMFLFISNRPPLNVVVRTGMGDVQQIQNYTKISLHLDIKSVSLIIMKYVRQFLVLDFFKV